MDASTFSSTSSSCSGGGPGDTDILDSSARVKNVVESVFVSSMTEAKAEGKTNGIQTDENRSISCVKETLPFPVSLKVTTNGRGWCWVMGAGSELSSGAANDTDLLKNPMKNALASLQGEYKAGYFSFSSHVV